MSRGEFDQGLPMPVQERRRYRRQSVYARFRSPGKGILELGGIRGFENLRFHGEAPCSGLRFSYARSRAWIAQDHEALDGWRGFFENFDALALQIAVGHRQASYVAGRSRKIVDNAISENVTDYREHNWRFGLRCLKQTIGSRTHGDDNVKILAAQFIRELTQAIGTAVSPEILDLNIPADNQIVLDQADFELLDQAGSVMAGLDAPRKATRGIRAADRWADAVTGQAAAPPKKPKNSRRLMSRPGSAVGMVLFKPAP